jgi:predicted phosphodiesterase
MLSRSSRIKLYALGDVHIGALNCAEHEFMKIIRSIQDDPDAYWVGGGDYCDAVILGDAKRFDVNTLPNWMLEGGPDKVKSMVGDILKAQQDRFIQLTYPIKNKCLGLIEGNHEFSIFKHHNRDHMKVLCDGLDAPNLTDCAFLRLKFKRAVGVHEPVNTALVFICHGHGGGRTAGAEPMKLARLAQDKDVDVLLTGHSHSFRIEPPTPVMWVPSKGRLPDSPFIREKHVANWGCFMYTYKKGPSTYASRDNYPVRPMYTVQLVFHPFRVVTAVDQGRDIYQEEVRIESNPIRL